MSKTELMKEQKEKATELKKLDLNKLRGMAFESLRDNEEQPFDFAKANAVQLVKYLTMVEDDTAETDDSDEEGDDSNPDSDKGDQEDQDDPESADSEDEDDSEDSDDDSDKEEDDEDEDREGDETVTLEQPKKKQKPGTTEIDTDPKQPAPQPKKSVTKKQPAPQPKEEQPDRILGQQAMTKKALDKAPKVMFMVPLSQGEKPGARETVTINGYKYDMEKGAYVEIPLPVAKLLAEHYKLRFRGPESDKRLDSMSPDKSSRLT